METITELPLSVHAVVSNDDTLSEILLRLPVVSLVLFKSVSKRWLSLITNPNFTLRRRQMANLDLVSGVFHQHRNISTDDDEDTFEYDFRSFDSRIPKNTSFSFLNDADNVDILQSCNGLLFCSISSKFYVYNPSVNMYKMIPRPTGKIHIHDKIRMAFDPTKSPHYKLVHARCIKDSVQIQTYTSQTGNWSVCNKRFPDRSFYNFSSGIFYNDSIHWQDHVPVKRGPLHYELDVDRLILTSIETPPINDDCERVLFESRGCLLLVCVYTDKRYSRYLNVYEKCNYGYSRWSLKYTVNLTDIMIRILDSWRTPAKGVWPRVWCIVLGEEEEDSFIVMEICGRVVQFKFVLKTLKVLYELKTTYSITYQFIASFATV